MGESPIGTGAEPVLLDELREPRALHSQEGCGPRDVSTRLGEGARDAVALDVPLEVAQADTPADGLVGRG